MPENDTVVLRLFNPHEGLTGRDGGPYLDQIENEKAEERRAEIEGRKPLDPNKETLPASAGTPLVTGPQLVNLYSNNNSNPSMESVDPFADALEGLVKDKTSTVEDHGSVEVQDLSKYPDPNPADPTSVSTDSVTDGESNDDPFEESK
jgi:hypothetical protein